MSCGISRRLFIVQYLACLGVWEGATPEEAFLPSQTEPMAYLFAAAAAASPILLSVEKGKYREKRCPRADMVQFAGVDQS